VPGASVVGAVVPLLLDALTGVVGGVLALAAVTVVQRVRGLFKR
jgi:hypothetical protein